MFGAQPDEFHPNLHLCLNYFASLDSNSIPATYHLQHTCAAFVTLPILFRLRPMTIPFHPTVRTSPRTQTNQTKLTVRLSFSSPPHRTAFQLLSITDASPVPPCNMLTKQHD